MSYPEALSLMQRGRANPSDYMVLLPTIASAEAGGTGAKDQRAYNDYLRYFCRAITLPSTANAVTSLRGQEHVGIARPVVTGRNYGTPVVMTVTDRSDLFFYNTIKTWIDSTILNSSQRQDRSLRVNYYNDCTHDVEIFKLEPIRMAEGQGIKGHRATGKWTLINCIPLAIEQTTLALDAADSTLDFTASLAYESFKYEPLDINVKADTGYEFDGATGSAAIQKLASEVIR